MKKYRVGLIRVLTTDDTQLMQMHGALIEQYFPMLQVESRCIPDQPEGIHDDQTMALGAPKGYSATVDQAQRQKQLGADVIALSCTGMSSIQIAPALERETGLPVLDPVMCEGLMTLFELIRKDARTQ